MTVPSRSPPVGAISRLLEPVYRLIDGPLRDELTALGYRLVDGDTYGAIDGLRQIERRARSRSVRGSAIAGLAYAHLAVEHWAEAERVAARHPDLSSDPLLELTLRLRSGHLDARFSDALADCTYAVSAMGMARTILDTGKLDDVVALAEEGSAPAPALLALQMGLNFLGEHTAAVGVGHRVVAHEQWDIAAYFLAVDSAALGEDAAALTWLARAADGGLGVGAAVDRQPHFERLRQLPEFEAVRARIGHNRLAPEARFGGPLWTGRSGPG